MYSYPLIKETGGIGLVYLFLDADRHPLGGRLKQRRKLLIISCDGQGIVSDVAYTASEPN